MTNSIVTRKLGAICAFVLYLLLLSEVATATNVLTADRIGSSPANLTQSVLVEKGKKPGLFFRFKCVEQTTLADAGNVCFPIQSTSSTTVVTVKIGNNSIKCDTVPGLPGTCSYTLVDQFQHSNTCGPASNQPCVDTVQIVYNGIFPAFITVQYSVSGVTGVSGEFENGANLVSFGTGGDTPPTVSLELVFDISGSMGLFAVPGGTVKRIEALQASSQVLFAMLNSYALPPGGTVPGDKLGAVFFSTLANPDTTPPTCSGLTSANLVFAADPNQVKTISQAVTSQVPTFSTSIGAGLQAADCEFTKETSPQNVNRTILLFSDGEQNTPPNVQVVANAVQVSDNTGANFANYPSNSNALCPSGPVPCVSICPVTAGRLPAPGFNLQQNIANAACGGNNAHIRDMEQTFVQDDLETFFAQSLTKIVTSDKLEIVANTIGTVLPEHAAVEKFLGAANDVKMTIVLSWSGCSGQDRILPFQLKAPDGTVIDLPNRTTFGNNISFTTILFPLFQGGKEIAQKGEWQITLKGESLKGPPCKYHLLAMADNPTVASDFTIDVKDAGTGEPIPIRVRLTDGGVPVLKASVQAQLMGPSNSQGNVLSRTPLRAVASSPGSDPAATKGQAKLDALFSDRANVSLFADNSLPTITLHDAENTGVYTGSFTGSSNEGHYYFTIRVLGKSPIAGDFQRTFWIARFVRSKPDPAKTVLTLLSSTAQPGGSVLVKLRAIPHDHLGNFLGPGYEKDMQINSSAGTVETPLDDKLDGSYETTYRLPSASSNPAFTIVILGTTVKTKTLKELQPGRLAISLAGGAGFPHGTFGNAFNNGFSLNAGLEYMVNNSFSVEGIFGYHHFPAKIGSNVDVYQFSAGGKIFLIGGATRPFLNAGVGGYKFNPGSTNFGGNFGGGLRHDFTAKVGLQASYNFHVVNTPGTATRFSSVQGGVRFVF